MIRSTDAFGELKYFQLTKLITNLVLYLMRKTTKNQIVLL